MESLAVVALAVVLGAVLGLIAFFRSLSMADDIRRLRGDVDRLNARLADREAGLASAPERAAAPESAAARDRTSAQDEIFEPSEDAAETPTAPGEVDPARELAAASVPPVSEVDARAVSSTSWRPEDQSNASEAGATPGSLESGGLESGGLETGGLEKGLAGNWLIWVGGAALALGGAFLLKSAIDAGFFGPVMRVVSAMVAGGAMIAAGEWLRRAEASEDEDGGGQSDASAPQSVTTRQSLAPLVLAGAGGSTIYGAIYAAYGLYSLLPSMLTLVLLTAACAGMIVLAALHRAPLVAVLALIGAYVSPALTASGEPNPNALLLYVFGVSAAGMIVARIMRWGGVSAAALLGGIAWPLVVLTAGTGEPPWGLYFYAPFYLVLAGLVAWDAAGDAIDMNAFFDQLSPQKPGPSEPDSVKPDSVEPGSVEPVSEETGEPFNGALATFYLAAVAVMTLASLTAIEAAGAAGPVIMWAVMGATTLIGAWRRNGFALAPYTAFMPVLCLVGFTEFGRAFSQESVAVFFGAVFALGGFALMRTRQQKGPGAGLAAFAPIGFLAALFHYSGQPADGLMWSMTAFAFVGFSIAILNDLSRRAGGFDPHPGAVSVLALGGTLASTLAVVMTTDGFMMSAGIALQAPILVWLWRRFDVPALKYAAGALALIATVRLFWAPEAFSGDFGATPIVNWLLVAYLAPAAGFWVSAQWLRGGGLAPTARVLQGMEGAAIALFAAFVTLQIRHLMHDGVVDASRYELAEVSLQTINWLSIAAFLRWRFGASLSFVRRLAELALIILGAAHMALLNLLALNPWWGDGPLINGPPIVNLLFLAYLAPAGVFAVMAYAARRSGARLQARLCGLVAALLGFVWLILSIRHGFQGQNLSYGSVGDAESWAYSIATIGFAATALIVGAVRRSAVFRRAGFCALALAIGKVFLVDTAALDGVWRATAFLGLGAALVGVAVLYQRIVSPIKDADVEGAQ
ncbi:MAG: DUF2339 domain-containing protein [Pseudomonadota bacterium]